MIYSLGDGLWSIEMSLNPCCNGIYLMIFKGINYGTVDSYSLNPCCNGIYLMIDRSLKILKVTES